MKLLIVAIVTASVVGASLGQVLSFGRCPSVTVQDNFDITKVSSSSASDTIPSGVQY